MTEHRCLTVDVEIFVYFTGSKHKEETLNYNRLNFSFSAEQLNQNKQELLKLEEFTDCIFFNYNILKKLLKLFQIH